MKKATSLIQYIKVRDLKIGDIVRIGNDEHTIKELHPYGTSYHSQIVVTNLTPPQHAPHFDNLHEFELVGFMSPFFTIPAKPKRKRVSKVVQRVQAQGYDIERQGREWHVWKKDDHSVTAIYDTLKEIPETNPV